MSVLLKQFVEFTSATSFGSVKVMSTHWEAEMLAWLLREQRPCSIVRHLRPHSLRADCEKWPC